MKRTDLEHLIRAAGAITSEREFIIIGSQAILGTYPAAPPAFVVSREADIYPKAKPELAELIDGSIGEESAFDLQFGYYAQGVGPETAKLPTDWESRLVRVQNDNTNHNVGFCLHPSDLAASKLAAGREKDLEFVDAMLKHKFVSPSDLRLRLDGIELDLTNRRRVNEWVRARADLSHGIAATPSIKPKGFSL